MEPCETFKYEDGLYLDCSYRDLVQLPPDNYDKYAYADFQGNYITEARVSDFVETIFDFRGCSDVDLLCQNIEHTPGQTIYPCEFPDDYDDDEHEKDSNQDKDDDGNKLLWLKVVGWLVFALIFTAVFLFVAIKVHIRRRKGRLGGKKFYYIIMYITLCSIPIAMWAMSSKILSSSRACILITWL